MNRQMCKTPTISQMREIVWQSLAESKSGSNILKDSKYLGDIVDEFRYEQRWQDKYSKDIYSITCEDVRMITPIVEIKPLDCPM